MTERLYTESGQFVVFHSSQAGSPDAFEDDGYYFEPNNPHGGDDVYSNAYPTAEMALAAAEKWEREEANEQAGRNDLEETHEESV